MGQTLALFLRDLFASWIALVGVIMRLIPFAESLVVPLFTPLLRKFPKAENYLKTHAEALKKNLKVIALVCLFVGPTSEVSTN